MKYDLNQKPTRFAERTLADFSGVLFELLAQKPFEQITVNELCEIANYPRATFYNYFDDIYDLTNYCWLRMASDIQVTDYADMPHEERMYILFDRCYAYLDAQESTIEQIMRHNPMDGRFVETLRRFLREQIYTIIINSPCSVKYPVPYEMIAEHYSNTIQMVLEWCFLKEEKLTKAEAEKTLRYLLGGL